MNDEKLQKMVLAALLAALTCVATSVIHIPTPGTGGYLNLGDCAVLLGAFLLGPAYGAAAAGIGSMLADLLLGYAAYAPATLAVKALMAVCAAVLFRGLREKIGAVRAALIGGAAAELWMVSGYFGYEAAILRYGAGALASVPSNLAQGALGLLGGVLLYQTLAHVPAIRKMFRTEGKEA